MRKFSGKCFMFEARKTRLRCTIALSGEAGFDIGRNKISPRANEPGKVMQCREVNSWSTTRGEDTSATRWLSSPGYPLDDTAGSDHTKGRRDNDNYNYDV